MLRLIACICSLFIFISQVYAFDIQHGKIALEGGVYQARQGSSQNIRIDGLVGDRYTVDDSRQNAGLLGLGYYFPAADDSLYLGINAYILSKTTVKGSIIQEQLFENLSYRYDLIHIPIYAALKGRYPFCDDYAITANAGLGANIMKLHNYHDESIDGGVTLPDDAFKSETNVVFSGMIGVGFEFSDLFFHQPVEIGYQFFYLGEGHFPGRNDHIQNLDTGNIYAHSLILTFLIDV